MLKYSFYLMTLFCVAICWPRQHEAGEDGLSSIEQRLVESEDQSRQIRVLDKINRALRVGYQELEKIQEKLNKDLKDSEQMYEKYQPQMLHLKKQPDNTEYAHHNSKSNSINRRGTSRLRKMYDLIPDIGVERAVERINEEKNDENLYREQSRYFADKDHVLDSLDAAARNEENEARKESNLGKRYVLIQEERFKAPEVHNDNDDDDDDHANFATEYIEESN